MLFVLLSIFFMSIVCVCAKNSKNKQCTECVFMCILLMCIAGFQSIELAVVDDLENYKTAYLNVAGYSYYEILQSDYKDPLFFCFAKFCSGLGMNVGWWMSIIGGMFAVAYSWFCLKYAKNILICYLMILATVFSFTLTGLRQTMAISLVLIAYHWIFEKKLYRFILTVLLASCFHSTAILFLPAYLVSKIKFSWWNVIVTIFIVCMVIPFADGLRMLILYFAWDSYVGYADRSIGLTWAGMIIQFLIFNFCVIFKKQEMAETEKTMVTQIDIFLNMMLVSAVFLCMSVVIAEMFRIAYFYNVCNGVAVGNVISLSRDSKARVLTIGSIYFVVLSYLIYTGSYSNLHFIWSE